MRVSSKIHKCIEMKSYIQKQLLNTDANPIHLDSAYLIRAL